MRDFVAEIKGHSVEYYDDEHVYLVDGIIVPSITQIVKVNDPDKYKNVSPVLLERAARAGTAVHEAIEDYINMGIEGDFPELRGFRFLQKHYHFTVEKTEVPVILFRQCRKDFTDEPIACGRLDLLIRNDDGLGIADIKRTATLDKNYLAYQLNMYRMAYQQSYGGEITFLAGLHLREDVRKYVRIPIAEQLTTELIDKYFTEVEHE